MTVSFFQVLISLLLLGAVVLLWRIDRRLIRIEINWDWAAAAMRKWGILIPPDTERKPPGK